MEPLLGTKLSHYTIAERLGAGGMGVVYRAFDERLRRDVAIKVLPGGLLAEESSRRRFRREVLAISQLSHPNITLVYDFDTQGDLEFLAMELVQGETLADRLRRGPLSLDGAVDLGAQLASALESAHRGGVIHRDLKPGNVMLTSEGRVKVLDFGLAGSVESEEAPEPVTEGAKSRTGAGSGSLTLPGQVMGTLGYMSPEQLRAEPQDHRTDIFSFGCVLFECVSGRRAFPGETFHRVATRVLTGEPDWAAPTGLPAELETLLRQCLERDPSRRLARIAEARETLERLSGRARPPSHAARGIGSIPNNLPAVPTTFVGRDRDLVECARLLGTTRLLTLVGPGGCGKTRLVIRLAETLAETFPEGLWFVDLAPVADGSRLEEALASAMGIRVEGDDLFQAIARRLQGDRALLLLDNCEHLRVATASFAGRILEECPSIRCVATSREPLGTAEERSYVVPSLSVPRSKGAQSADSIAPYESVRLLCDRIQGVSPDFQLTDETARPVAEICRRLDGIPLAIELAAARVGSFTVDEIRSKLDDRFRLLGAEEAALLPRHQTLRAAIQWSDDLLIDVERDLLRTLSVFVGGWTLEAATMVFASEGQELQVLDLMSRLVDKSLLVVDRATEGAPRYRLLESIREYALEKLIGSEHEHAIRDRHSRVFTRLAEGAERGLVGADQKAWLERVEVEHENLLAAIEWCSRPDGDFETALRIAGYVWRFWYGRGYFTLGRETLERVLAVTESLVASPNRGRALRAAGVLAYYQTDYPAARAHLSASLALFRSLGDQLNTARGLNGLAGVLMDLGEYDEARPLLEESLAISRAISDPGGVGVALGNLGTMALYQGDDVSAREHLEGAMAGFRESGDLGNVAGILSALGSLMVRQRDYDSGRARLAESLTLARQLGEQRIAAYAIDGVADLVSAGRDPARAARLLGAASGLRERIGAPLMPREAKGREAATARVRRRMPRTTFESHWAMGVRMSFEASVEYGLESLTAAGRSVGDSGVGSTPAVAISGASSTAFLLDRAQKGDLDARDQLARRLFPVLTRWAHGRLPAAARGMIDTDDLVQETVVRAFRRLEDFEVRGEGALVAYLRKILLNRLRDEARRAAREPDRATVDRLRDEGPSPLQELIGRHTLEAYEDALSRLPEAQRQSVILRVEMGYSFRQVAEAVNAASANAARMSVNRGIRRIAKLMER